MDDGGFCVSAGGAAKAMTRHAFYDRFHGLYRRAMNRHGSKTSLLKPVVAALTALGLIAGAPPVAQATVAFECREEVSQKERQDLLKAVSARYRQITDLSSRFEQESYFLGLDQRVVSRGEVRFKKPGLMDWVYEDPEPQRFVADGRTLWFHQPEQNQVTVGEFNQAFSSDLPVSFLLGIGNLEEDFALKSACKSTRGIVLELQPKKKDASLDQFSLLVSKSDREPIGAKVVDAGGNETEIVFDDIKLNGGIDEKRFTFDIPKGTDVVKWSREQGPLGGKGDSALQ